MLESAQLALYSLDCLFSLVIVSPLSICWWYGTWTLLNIYNFSWLFCLITGLIGYCLLSYWTVPAIGQFTIPSCSVLHVTIVRGVNYALAVSTVCSWRGVWYWMDDLTNTDRKDLAVQSNADLAVTVSLLCTSVLVLIVARVFTTAVGQPFIMLCDLRHQYYQCDTLLGSEFNDSSMFQYSCDAFLSVFLVLPPVILIWRSVWDLITPHPAYLCLSVGYAVALIVMVLTPALQHLCSAWSRCAVWLIEILIKLLATASGVAVWSGGWRLLEMGLRHRLSNEAAAWLAHAVGFVGLLIMMCSSSVAPIGVHRDSSASPAVLNLSWPMVHIREIYRLHHRRIADQSIEQSFQSETSALLQPSDRRGRAAPQIQTSS